MDKDRARIVIERYGIVFRELLQRELPALRWSRLFRTLRMMELSGEVVAGGFVAGVAGIQFALPRALPVLAGDGGTGNIIWMNAADPMSPCGLAIGKSYPDLSRMLAPLRNMISRRWNPRKRVAVEIINETDARESPYAEVLVQAGFRRDYKRLVLSAGYR
ncbi:MAG: hypothetical protein V3S41_04205 [Spirochaetia bacterium]